MGPGLLRAMVGKVRASIRWQPQSQTSTWPLIVTQTLAAVGTHSQVMARSGSPGLDITMAPGISTGHGWPLAAGRPQTSQTPVCVRTMDPDMASGGSMDHTDHYDTQQQHGLGTPTWLQVAVQGPRIGLFLTTISSLAPPLSTVHEPLRSLSLPSLHHTMPFHLSIMYCSL